MSRRVMAAALLLCLLPLPTAMAAHAAAVGVVGPDPDGAYTLSFDVHRDAAGVVALDLAVVRTDADGTATGSRALGSAELPAGTTRRDVSFLPAEGPGRYTVTLLVDAVAGASVSFDVDDAAAATSVTFELPDHPTYLNLTNDSVNADGRLKSPGEALITRASVSDANGLADLDALLWRVERQGAFVVGGPLAPPPSATSWSFEHRFEDSPFEAGNYTLRLHAVKNGSVVAAASRTFAIRDVLPTLVSGALANVTPDTTSTQTVTVTLADRNGLPSSPIETRVYRASTRVEGQGFGATLAAPERLADQDGAARFAYPLTLVVPERATAGSYRVSLYSDGTLLGSLPFEVRALPTLSSVNASTQEGRLALEARGTGDGILVARLTDGNGSTTTVSASFANGSAALALDPPRRGTPLRWNLTLHARADGPALAWREGNWSAPADGPALTLAPLHVRSRLPATWQLSAAWPLEGVNASFTFTRWDGLSEPRIQATLVDDVVRVEAPADLPAGRYTGRILVSWSNGTASEASWSFDAGPWVEVTLGLPTVEARTASVPLRNAGGVTVTRLVVETEPLASVKLLRGGETIAPGVSGGRATFATSLAPGEQATLQVQLGEGAMRSGRHDVQVRVLAQVSLG